MINNPILDLPLTEVMRKDIALPLQHVLNIFTVGNLLTAWRNPQTQRTIEEFFESSVQAQHAVATCAAWLGFPTGPAPSSVPAWWVGDAPPGEVACV